MTARRATVEILKSFDDLIKNPRYNSLDKPKFDFDVKEVKKRLVDIYVDEEKDRNALLKEDGGSGRISSRRSTHSAR